MMLSLRPPLRWLGELLQTFEGGFWDRLRGLWFSLFLLIFGFMGFQEVKETASYF
jgi:hypothetical protein